MPPCSAPPSAKCANCQPRPRRRPRPSRGRCPGWRIRRRSARAVAPGWAPLRCVPPANGFAGRITCVTAAGFQHPVLRARAPYDLVFANILAGPLKRLAPEMAAHQRSGGVAILSGLLTRQAPGVLAVYRGWGYARIDRVPIGEWTTLVLRRD